MDRTLSRLALAGFVTAIVDGLFSSVLSVAFYHSTVTRLFQGVASVLVGPSGHIPFVGFPIAASIGTGSNRTD